MSSFKWGDRVWYLGELPDLQGELVIMEVIDALLVKVVVPGTSMWYDVQTKMLTHQRPEPPSEEYLYG